jgi:hypothetical protein
VKVRQSFQTLIPLADVWYLSGTLTDLSKYGPKVVDGGVVAWPTDYTTPDRKTKERTMEFTIKAQVLSAKAGASIDKEGQDAVKPDSKDEL